MDVERWMGVWGEQGRGAGERGQVLILRPLAMVLGHL